VVSSSSLDDHNGASTRELEENRRKPTETGQHMINHRMAVKKTNNVMNSWSDCTGCTRNTCNTVIVVQVSTAAVSFSSPILS